MVRLTMIIFVIIGVFGAFAYVVSERSENLSQINDANRLLFEGIHAKTIYERKTKLNEALAIMGELEKEFNPRFGSGHLYMNIGQIYEQLQSYPYALLYYYRALQLDPNNPLIKERIAALRTKLQIPPLSEMSPFQSLAFFHTLIPLPKRLQLVFFFALLTLLFLTVYFWIKERWARTGALITVVFLLVFSLSVAVTKYVEPLQGVLVRATLPSRELMNQDNWVSEQPLPAGLRVTVVDILDGGQWFKILTDEGELGFVSAERIRVI